MKTSIEIPECHWKERFRVYGKVFGEEKLLFSSDYYQESEQFCWRCEAGPSELRIQKVWIRKQSLVNSTTAGGRMNYREELDKALDKKWPVLPKILPHHKCNDIVRSRENREASEDAVREALAEALRVLQHYADCGSYLGANAREDLNKIKAILGLEER